MGMVPARCTQCGANITVDESKEAGICENCGTPFITEKAINNYITNIQNTTNVEKQTNIYLGENLFEKEKRECKLLFMLLNKMDLQYLKDQALKVLSVNPDNSIAQTIYDCDFTVEYYNEYLFLEFDEQPLHQFLEKECGNIDAETSLTFIKALLCKAANDTNVANLVKLIFKNLSKQNLDNDSLYNTYKTIAMLVGNLDQINTILYTSKLNKALGVINMFNDSSSSVDNFNDASEKKKIALSMLESRKIIAPVFWDMVRRSNLTDAQKNDIRSKITTLLDTQATQNNTQTTQNKEVTNKAQQKPNNIYIKYLGIFLISLGALFFIGSIISDAFVYLLCSLFCVLPGIFLVKKHK